MASTIKCDKCNTYINNMECFYLIHFKEFSCSSCYTQQPFMDCIKIMPSTVCAFVKRCSNQAILHCPANEMFYCKTCHVKYCEQDAEIAECATEKLIFGPDCSICGNPADYCDPSSTRFTCHVCFQDDEHLMPLIDRDKEILKNVIDNLIAKCQEKRSKNSSIIRKMQENLKKITSVMKRSYENDNIFDEPLAINKEKLKINYSKNAKLQEIIDNFSIQSKVMQTILNKLEQRRVDLGKIISYLNNIEQNVVPTLTCDRIVNKMKISFEETELVASQPLNETYDDPTAHDIVSSQDSLGVGSPLEIMSSEEVTCELEYHRGPLWLAFLKPNLAKERDTYLRDLKKYEGKKMDEKAIKIGAHVIVKEGPQYGAQFKRAYITRHGDGPGKFCVNLLDFGKSLYVHKSQLFETPKSMDKQEATFFMGSLIGIKPVSKFAFTAVCKPNAHSIINDKLLPSDRMVQVKKMYKIGDMIYCAVVSIIRDKTMNWSQVLIDSHVSLPYHENMQCFVPKKNYCYFFHILNQCKSKKCHRSHECSFCENVHVARLVECKDYKAAEFKLIMSSEQ